MHRSLPGTPGNSHSFAHSHIFVCVGSVCLKQLVFNLNRPYLLWFKSAVSSNQIEFNCSLHKLCFAQSVSSDTRNYSTNYQTDHGRRLIMTHSVLVSVCYSQIASMARTHNAPATISSGNKKIYFAATIENTYAAFTQSVHADDDLYLFPRMWRAFILR